MRLLFLTNGYPPHHIGGYEELCDDVARGLRQRGHSVDVLTTRTEGASPEPHVYRLLHPVVGPGFFRANLGFFVGRQRRESENKEILKDLIRQIEPAVVLVWGMWNLPRSLAHTAEETLNCRTAYYIADYWPTLPDAYVLHWREPARRGLTAWPKRFLGMIALGAIRREPVPPLLAFDQVMCVSDALRQRLNDDGIPLRNAVVVHNGIDLRAFAPRPDDGRKLREPIKLLYAGRLAPEKGIETIFRALAIMRKRGRRAHLTILGSGNQADTDSLLTQVARLRLEDWITFEGRIPRNDMPGWMTKCDVLIVPSRWPEPLPRVAQEAMAMQIVTLATPVGGIPELIEDGVNGLLFPPGDAEALADCIERLLVDSELYFQLASNGRTTIGCTFGIDRMIDEIVEYAVR